MRCANIYGNIQGTCFGFHHPARFWVTIPGSIEQLFTDQKAMEYIRCTKVTEKKTEQQNDWRIFSYVLNSEATTASAVSRMLDCSLQLGYNLT